MGIQGTQELLLFEERSGMVGHIAWTGRSVILGVEGTTFGSAGGEGRELYIVASVGREKFPSILIVYGGWWVD